MRGIFGTLLADDRAEAAKAAFGSGVTAFESSIPLWSTVRSPQEFAKQAQSLYHTAPWIHRAEYVVSSTFATTPWHLEDEDDNEINDDPADSFTPSAEQLAAFAFMDQPQSALPDLQPSRNPALAGYMGISNSEFRPGRRRLTRRELWQLTRRHSALCGTSFWLLDQTDGLAGTPLAAIYINPARMWAAEDEAANLTGWVLDWNGQKGMPLSMDEVVPFYFDPPDYGHFGVGLVESAIAGARLNELAARHMGGVLSSGGRLAGIIGPKSGTPGGIPDEKYKQLLRDLRNVVEDPNAAKRTIALQGPVEFTPTSATPVEIGVLDLMNRSREDTFGQWGVPPAAAGFASPAGLNSGDASDGYKRALWEGAISPWVTAFTETVQVHILDRWKRLGARADLEIEEPEFDDESGAYDLLNKAGSAPITVLERRAIIGLPPFGDKVLTPEGARLDDVILLPTLVSEAYVAAEKLPEPPPEPPVPPLAGLGGPPPPDGGNPPPPPPPGATGGQPPALAGKAKRPWEPTRPIRAQIESRMIPRLRGAIARLLGEQRADVVARLRRLGIEHLRSKRSDTSGYFPADQWDRRLARAIEPHAAGIATHMTGHLGPRLAVAPAPQKAAVSFEDRVVSRVRRRGAERVVGINRTTRERLAATIAAALDADDATIDDVIADVEAMPWFDELRAETIARTEAAFAMNDATLGTFEEYGVEEVDAIDGDGDPECAERDGQRFSVEEAADIEDHPNGTLDWAPVVD